MSWILTGLPSYNDFYITKVHPTNPGGSTNKNYMGKMYRY